jgi:hypothetical protein
MDRGKDDMLIFLTEPRRKALLFTLVPGGVAVAVWLALVSVLGGPVAALLTAFVAMVALLVEVSSALALVVVRPPVNRGMALAWGVVLFAGSLLLTWLLLIAFGSPKIL